MPSPRLFLLLPTATAVLALAAISPILPPAMAAREGTDKPYKVVDGNKVDIHTYKGYLYYGDSCLRCHGPDGLGSSYAPNLTDSLKTMSKEQFETTVMSGKQEVNQASDKVMPAFGTVEDVVNNLDNIYAYLKARSDGALGRGHPEHLDE